MIHRNRILHTVRQGVAAMALAVCSISSFAAITFEKTFIRLPAAAFEKGIDFPLLGLHEENETRYISVRVFKWEQRDNEQIVLSPTDDFTVFPQLVRVTTDSRKTIRIKANRPLKNEKESYYRIVLEEFDRPDLTRPTGRRPTEGHPG